MNFQVPLGEALGGQAIAHVKLIEPFGMKEKRFILDWVSVSIKRRKNEARYEPNHDDPFYRRGNMVERFAYDERYFRELLGFELYRAALVGAWEQLKPPIADQDTFGL